MKTPLVILIFTVTCLLLAGCGENGPSTQSVHAALEEKLPPQLTVKSIVVDFIPGSDEQGVVRVEAKVQLTEDLFEQVPANLAQVGKAESSENVEMEARQAAEQKGVAVPKALEDSLATAKDKVRSAESSAAIPVIKQVQKAGDNFEFSMKGRAVKEGKTWAVLGLSGETPRISGQPRNTIASNAVLEGDPTLQNTKDALENARVELEAARTTFVEGLHAGLREKEAAMAKQIADQKAALKETCTKEPFYGVWSTERGRGEIGLRFSRFDEVGDENILIEGVFFNPGDPKESKLFVGTLSGNGSIEKPYSLRINVPQGNGVAAQWNAVVNTTTGILLDECTFDVDLVFDRDFKRLRGMANRNRDGARIAVEFGSYEHQLQFVFSKSFTPSSQNKGIIQPHSEQKPADKTSTAPPSSTSASGESPDTTKGSPQIASRLITEADIAGWGSKEIQNALNEMYARHGLTFKDKNLQKQFSQNVWYRPNPDLSHEQVEASFSDIEHANKEFLAAARNSQKISSAQKKFSSEETNLLYLESGSDYVRFIDAMNAKDRSAAETALRTLKTKFPNSPSIFTAEMMLATAEKNRSHLEAAYQALKEKYTLDKASSKVAEHCYTTGLEIIKTTSSAPLL